MPEEQKQETQENAAPEMAFPAITGPTHHLDQARGVFWIGVPLLGIDWESVKLYIEGRKFEAFQLWKAYSKATKDAQDVQERIANGERTKSGLADFARRIMARR